MNQTILEIKLELVITGSGDFNVEVRRVGGGMRKRVKNHLLGQSRSNDLSVSFTSTDGSYSYHEIPVRLSLVSHPLADDIEMKHGGKSPSGEVVDNPNG